MPQSCTLKAVVPYVNQFIGREWVQEYCKYFLSNRLVFFLMVLSICRPGPQDLTIYMFLVSYIKLIEFRNMRKYSFTKENRSVHILWKQLVAFMFVSEWILLVMQHSINLGEFANKFDQVKRSSARKLPTSVVVVAKYVPIQSKFSMWEVNPHLFRMWKQTPFLFFTLHMLFELSPEQLFSTDSHAMWPRDRYRCCVCVWK